MKATRNVLAALCALAECGPLWATNFKEAAEMTVPREYRTSDGEVFRYRWAEPEKTEFGRRYPIVVLLHGAGERGTNNVDQLVHGAGPLLLYMKERGIAGYFLAGQMPCGEQWVNTPSSQTSHRMPKKPSTQMARLFETLDAVMRERAEAAIPAGVASLFPQKDLADCLGLELPKAGKASGNAA